jgi:alcohol dehydrogenase class IV
MEFTMPACPEKFAKMADAMGENTTGLTMREAGMKAVESVRRLQKIIEIPTLVEYGIDVKEYRESIPQMVKDGIASGSHRLNPRVPTEQELYKLYESLLN